MNFHRDSEALSAFAEYRYTGYSVAKITAHTAGGTIMPPVTLVPREDYGVTVTGPFAKYPCQRFSPVQNTRHKLIKKSS